MAERAHAHLRLSDLHPDAALPMTDGGWKLNGWVEDDGSKRAVIDYPGDADGGWDYPPFSIEATAGKVSLSMAEAERDITITRRMARRLGQWLMDATKEEDA
ncbi:hypothetical protein BACT_1090 [Bifidobacterium actinocoloniiforme DSM 22766]|uniref:Uncharacterized protein n=2 Tax=Bifidobacterium actinocoloniiforme TaxID=638619 RepID=A0A086Z1I8_9BIFI|nr:hypothetical protein BACT_1090 [Bifidobacterium actinocoloniiforme DSM 22766]